MDEERERENRVERETGGKEGEMENHPHSRTPLSPLFYPRFVLVPPRVYAFPLPFLPARRHTRPSPPRPSSPTGVCAAANLPSAATGSGGRSRGRFSCTGAHRPPTGDPQYAANSHKAPTDTQMDKRMDIRTSAPGLSR